MCQYRFINCNKRTFHFSVAEGGYAFEGKEDTGIPLNFNANLKLIFSKNCLKKLKRLKKGKKKNETNTK